MSPSVVAGLVLLALFWAWIFAFFARVRPWIMNALGRRLRVKVEESTAFVDAGTYGIKGANPSLSKTGIVLLADFAVLVLGTVGVAALLFVPAFLVAESGALLPLEAKLTGRAATLSAAAPATMPQGSGASRLVLSAGNDGREGLRDCVAGIDGYNSRNGYLHGTSARFDLRPGERRSVDIELSASRPPPGEHHVRVKLECANERLAVADAVLLVR